MSNIIDQRGEGARYQWQQDVGWQRQKKDQLYETLSYGGSCKVQNHSIQQPSLFTPPNKSNINLIYG